MLGRILRGCCVQKDCEGLPFEEDSGGLPCETDSETSCSRGCHVDKGIVCLLC